MWALVKHWSTLGCRRSKGARLASFEGFSGIVGGIVTNAFFADPIARPDVRLDETEAAWTSLFRKLADNLSDGGTVEYGLENLVVIVVERNEGRQVTQLWAMVCAIQQSVCGLLRLFCPQFV
jgi:hypothetical protein